MKKCRRLSGRVELQLTRVFARVGALIGWNLSSVLFITWKEIFLIMVLYTVWLIVFIAQHLAFQTETTRSG